MNNFKIDDVNFYKILDCISCSIYWKDTNGRYLGCNNYMLDMLQLKNRQDVIGKTDFDLSWREVAVIIRQNDLQVMSSKNECQEFEESTFIAGKSHAFLTRKSSLLDKNGNVEGIIGVSINITDKKELEELRLENLELQIKAQEQFRKLVGQMIHDIQSPLASMRMLMSHASDIPEQDRLLLRSITNRISDITQDMLNHYKPKQDGKTPIKEQNDKLLLSITLEELINEKRYEYKNLDIKFELQIECSVEALDFVFIKIGIGSFKRMMSNLINNAVEALVNKSGIITISYTVMGDQVKINVIDNGIGIPAIILTKLQEGVALTHNKQNGHGIGLAQVWETVIANNGKLNIDSRTGINSGTIISIELPTVPAPEWIVDKIKLIPDDIIVILDDDESIHGAWDIRLSKVMTDNPTIKVVHFKDGIELIHYINSLESSKKENIYLLSDYELLNQRVTGLDVIRISQIKRAILVTSHYTNSWILDNSMKQGVKVLPKSLVQSVKLELSKI